MTNQPEEQEVRGEAPDEKPPEAAAAIDAAIAAVEAEKARDELLRALAEIENTRKRAARDVLQARTYAIDRFARDLLSVADTLARALAALSPEARASADETTRNFLHGVELTERALIDVFARHDVKRVGEKGEPFDPNLHQAVAHAPSDVPANAVAEVMQAGYVLGERTLRPAMVVVSSGQAAAPGGGPESAPGGGVDIKV